MAERALCRHAPKVGAECLNWARSDLCGGRGVIPVPTAIIWLYAQFTTERSRRERTTRETILPL